jgi:proline dehydrogenase
MRMSSLRRPILWFAEHPWFRVAALRSGVWRRFVAGETLDDALAAARRLQGKGIAVMLDHLGENVATEADSRAATDAYVAAAEALHADTALDGAISVKLTQLGLDLSYELCLENVRRVLDSAGSTLVMIDMESHDYVDRTLSVYRELHGAHDRFGICLQAYLKRTAKDVFELPEGAVVRLVKGAYLETPDVAFPSRGEVDATFRRLFATLVARDCTVHLATHDARLVEGARRFGLPQERLEFQMLYGIRTDLQRELVAGGLPVRVYVPFGTEWYPYLTRRLAERPANLWFFLSNLVRGLARSR